MSAEVSPYPQLKVGDVVRSRARPKFPPMLIRQFEREGKVALLQLPNCAAGMNLDTVENVVTGVAYTYAPTFCLAEVGATYFDRLAFSGGAL